jgi:hypothetical protein
LNFAVFRRKGVKPGIRNNNCGIQLSGLDPCILKRRTPKEATEDFAEWAALFSGKLFVMLVAYADESGTEDRTGKIAKVAVVGGYVALSEEWTRFCGEWQTILSKYQAPYFHFREWAVASAIVRRKRTEFSAFQKNPYRGWDLKTLDSFVLELALVAGRGKRRFGGYINTEKFNDAKAKGEFLIGQDPYDYCLKVCFNDFIKRINVCWPDFTEPISFFWDWTNDRNWRRAILDAYDPFRKKDSRLAEITFADKTKRLPLQAADMVAYRMRQLSGKLLRKERSIMSEIDIALFGRRKRGVGPSLSAL